MLNTATDYVEALALLPMPPDREEYLRRRLWWASNDHLRLESGSPALETDVARANMERLLALLPFDSRTLERVELYRQLGHFQTAIELIPLLMPDDWRKAQLQQRWAKAKDSTMRVIPPQPTSAGMTKQGAVIW
jgi:hypothetical protein